METVVHDASPMVADPLGFLRRAAADLRRAPRIGWQLFRAELRAGQQRSLFGYVWLLLPAAMITLTGVYLQGQHVIAFGPTQLPYPVHVFAGMVLWQAFLDAFQHPLVHLRAARRRLTKTALSHEAVLLAGLLSVALNNAVRLAALGVFLLANGLPPSLDGVGVFASGMLGLTMLGTAAALAIAPIALLYDDVNRSLGVVTSLWFLVTPVIYASPRMGLLRLNPVTPLLDTARRAIVEPSVTASFAAVFAGSLLLMLIAWLGYRIASPHVFERLR